MNVPRRDFLRSGLLLGSGALLSTLTLTSRATAADMPAATVSDIWEIFRTRRSVRKFRPDPVPDADIEKMVAAAAMAPSSGGQQPCRFLVIRDRERIEQMQEACVKRALAYYDRQGGKPEARAEAEKGFRNRNSGYFTAPAFIVVLTDNNSRYPSYAHWDGPLAAGYLLLAARALGYGTVFITDSIPDEVTREVLRIPERYSRVCITPVGIPVEWPAPHAAPNTGDLVAYDQM